MDCGYRSCCSATVFSTAISLRLRPASVLATLAALLLFSTSYAVAQSRVVADQDSFYAALADSSVTHIQVAKSITINPNKGSGSWPLSLARDCLVDGAPNVSYPRLDFSFAKTDRVQLGPGVTLTFRGLILSNVISSSQLMLDFFAPSPASSTIVWQAVVDRRGLCKPIQDVAAAWATAPRPGGTAPDQASPAPAQQQQPASSPSPSPSPQAQEQQQLMVVDGPNCNGDEGCYTTSVLRSSDVLIDSPAGYRLRLNNTLTVCDQFISQSCIQSLGVDLCYLDTMEELKAKLYAEWPAGASGGSGSESVSQDGSGGGGGGGGLSAGAQAGIIAGCVVGGVALLALLVGFFVCRRWRFRRTTQQQCGEGGGEGNAFTALDPASEAAMQAYGSTRSVDTAATNTTAATAGVAPARNGADLLKIGSSKTGFRGGGGGGGDGRASLERSNSTDARLSPGRGAALVASLESQGSSYRVGVGSAPVSGGLRPSGSGTRDAALVSNSATTHPTTLWHSQHGGGGGGGGGGPGAGGSSSHPHSVGSFVMGVLRSMLHRSTSANHSHHLTAAAAAAQGSNGGGGSSAILASGSGAAVVAMSTGPTSGSAAAPRSGATAAAAPPRRAASLKSGGEGSSVPGTPPAGAGAARPSLVEMQRELERMEDQVRKESKGAKAAGAGAGGSSGTRGTARRSSSRRTSPRRESREFKEPGHGQG